MGALDLFFEELDSTGIIKWDPFGGDQTMQMDNFEGFPLNSALFGLVI